jgi:hypothetical protein
LPDRTLAVQLVVKAGVAVLGALLLALLVGVQAGAVPKRDGDLEITFDSDLHPSRLPRKTLAPISIRVAGNVRSASGHQDQVPQLRRITVAINRQGRLFDRGLPTCSVKSIQPATEAAARRVCGDSIVGDGHVRVQARIPGQLPFLVRARLLAFNGPRRDGRKQILAQAYARDPPGAFVLTFNVVRKPGRELGTILSTTLPPETERWAYLTHFDLTLHRTYSYRGKQRSYVSAACSAPTGFDVALFTLARATYQFAGGKRLSTSVAKTCRVT